MGKISSLFLCVLSIVLVLPTSIINQKPVKAQPLYTNSRWIVDESGQRVKLACVNWVSHLEVMVAEGLSKQPVDQISKRIGDMGFNCVRLTWPLFLVTNDSLASLTVNQSFHNRGLLEAVSGLKVNNPSMISLTLIGAYQAVVSSLVENNVMVILDNHVSKPGWCCSTYDGNGYFGDQYFNPDEWLKGLTRMATMFKDTKNVVGMSLRNELRGHKQNITDWYRYMQKGAEVVHAANPNVLVILSGLSYDKDFSFLLDRPVNLTFTGKLVFELHWYGFSDNLAWQIGNPNTVCGELVEIIMGRAGFVLDLGYPLFVSEFGVDQTGSSFIDNRYLNCFFSLAAELDLDWALWTLVGSYYEKDGVFGLDETFGLLNWNWCGIRNSSLLQRISALQSPFRGPGLSESKEHKLIFHPSTGLCVQKKSLLGSLKLGPCSESEAWSYAPGEKLTIKGTHFCLQAHRLGKAAKLGIICTHANSKWETISESNMHLSSKLNDDTTVCLDVDSSNDIVTNNCKCLSIDYTCDPGSQWFKIIESSTSGGKSFLWNSLISDSLENHLLGN